MALTFPQDPALARPVSQLPQPAALPGGCVYEPKLDGYRALLFVGDDRCRVQSRRGHDITEAFADVAAAAFDQLPSGLVLDGELVVWDQDGLSFTELQRRAGRGASPTRLRPASFVAFDVLEVADVDVRRRPLSVRRSLLETVTDGATGALQVTPQTSEVSLAREWLADYASADVGIEGLVVKGLASSYRGGERIWQKYRLRDTSEAIVCGVAGSLSAPEHLVLGRYDGHGVLTKVGTTTALASPQQTEVAAAGLVPAGDDHPWRTDPGGAGRGRTRQPVHLVEPTLVVEVSTDRSTDRGRWRHPVAFVRVRTDLGPHEVAETA